MGLSGLQFLGIAGGRAADIIRAEDVRRSKEYNAAFNKFIDNNVGALKTASAKQKLILNKAKKDISQIVSTYLKGFDFSDSVKYEIANTIYASHGYKMENVNADAQNRLQQYVNAGGDENKFNYVNEYITNAKDIKSERTLDQIAMKHAQDLAPMPKLDLAAKAVGLGKYKETAFVDADTDRIEKDLIAATGYKPDTTIPDGPTIGIEGPVVNVKDKLQTENILLDRADKDKARIISEYRKKKLEEELAKGDYTATKLNSLYNFQLGIEYNKQGLKVGQNADGSLTPKETGKATFDAQKNTFQYIVNNVIKAPTPFTGTPFIKNESIRNELARIGSSVPLAAKLGQETKQGKKFITSMRIVGRKYQSDGTDGYELGTEYIFLGKDINDIILKR